MESQVRIASTREELEHELAMLEQRLIDGEHRIEEAHIMGADTDAWETFWIELLHTYEALHDRLTSLSERDSRIAA